jgi:hypothetical protein
MAAVIASPCFAANAPPQLLGKTVTLSYNFGGMARVEGRAISATRHVSQVIYISSTGRLFARTSQTARTGSSFRERAPDETLWHFVNGKLIAQRASVSGAVMVAISFDPNFAGCTVSGFAGHESGKPYKWIGLDGRIYEADGPMSLSEAACSVSTGNGL